MTSQVDPTEDRIDILLATYNGERFLAEQLDSIEKQTHPNWRLIVRDDGSTDKTLDVIARFSAQHPNQVDILNNSDGNLGVVRNFSRLMERATGDYIAFCDQDDVWLPRKLELSLEKIRELEKDFGADSPLLVFSDLIIVDEDLQPIHHSYWSYQEVRPEWCNAFNRLLSENIVTGCTVLLNRILYDQVCPIPQGAKYHDWWTALVAAAFGHLDYCSKQTVLYRQHLRSVTGPRANRTFLRRAKVVLANWNFQKEVIRGRFAQAVLFRKRFGEQLESSDREALDGFIEFRDAGMLKRIQLAKRHLILPASLVRSYYFLFVSLK